MGNRTGINRTCENPECNNTFYCAPYRMARGKGKFCSNVCAGKGTFSGRSVPIIRCKDCGVEFQATGTAQQYCDVCGKRRLKRSSINSALKTQFGISLEDYEKILESQNGVCAICGGGAGRKNSRFAVDHDHETGRVRGLLCLYCNTRLGWLETYSKAIENYLK
jgi:Recombination endonuclease VII